MLDTTDLIVSPVEGEEDTFLVTPMTPVALHWVEMHIMLGPEQKPYRPGFKACVCCLSEFLEVAKICGLSVARVTVN